jgi:hypothetical protein
MTLSTYNGWTNYPTWDISCWLSSEEATNGSMEAIAQLAPNVSRLADVIRDFVEFGNPLASGASLYSDLLSWAIGLVNWDEIARAYWENTHDQSDERSESDD